MRLTPRPAWAVATAWALLFVLILVFSFSAPWPVTVAVLAASFAVAGFGRTFVANAVNGIWLRRDSILQAGHYIRLEGTQDVEGYVIRIGLRHTQLQTPAGDIARIPNTRLANSIFTNFFLPGNDHAIRIDIEADARQPRQVVQLLQQETLALSHDARGVAAGSVRIRILPGRFPGCNRYVVHCQSSDPEQRDQVRDRLERTIRSRLDEAGVRVPVLQSRKRMP